MRSQIIDREIQIFVSHCSVTSADLAVKFTKSYRFSMWISHIIWGRSRWEIVNGLTIVEMHLICFTDGRNGKQFKLNSLRKQPTFGDATTGLPAKWRLRNERRNSILMTRHYPDLGSASDWSCRVGNLIQPIRSATRIWAVTRHQYGISALVSQTSFCG